MEQRNEPTDVGQVERGGNTAGSARNHGGIETEEEAAKRSDECAANYVSIDGHRG
jgi:hypothetical protein